MSICLSQCISISTIFNEVRTVSMKDQKQILNCFTVSMDQILAGVANSARVDEWSYSLGRLPARLGVRVTYYFLVSVVLHRFCAVVEKDRTGPPHLRLSLATCPTRVVPPSRLRAWSSETQSDARLCVVREEGWGVRVR